jgi:hypothetical protein
MDRKHCTRSESGTRPKTEASNSLVYAQNAVYITDTAAATIEEINTSTLTVERSVATGLVTPYELAYSAGSLWTTSGEPDTAGRPLSLVGVDLATGTVTTYLSDLIQGTGLAANAGLPDTILSYDSCIPWDCSQ